MSKQPPLHVPAAPQSKIQVPPQAPQGPIWLQHLCKPPPSSWPGSSLCTALLLTHRQAQARPGLVFLPEGSAPLLHLPRPGLVFLSEGPGSLLPLPQPGLVSLSEGPAHSSTCLAWSHLSMVCSNVGFSLRPIPHLSHGRADFPAGQHLLSPRDEHGDITSTGISSLGLCICSRAQRSLRTGARGTQHLLPWCPWLLPEPTPPPGPTAEPSPARLPALLPA